MIPILRDERGETLVETLITLIVISLAVVTLLGGLAMATSTSAQHRRLAKAEVLVRGAAEQLKDRSATFSAGCGAPVVAAYNAQLDASQYSDFTVSVVEVQNWTGTTPASFSPTTHCTSTAQLITLRATAAAGDVTQDVQILKAKLS